MYFVQMYLKKLQMLKIQIGGDGREGMNPCMDLINEM